MIIIQNGTSLVRLGDNIVPNSLRGPRGNQGVPGQAIVGPPGPPGEPGTFPTDAPDFTLIFENQLL